MGVDVDPLRRAALLAGDVGHEPGLAEAFAEARGCGRFDVVGTPTVADAYIICVPTPLSEERSADLGAVYDAFAAVLKVAPSDAVIVLSSTVPVGTTEALAAGAPGRRIAYCPERVLPGKAFYESRYVDRVVGGVDPESTASAGRLWEAASRAEVLHTDARTAELVKLVENANRDAEIAIANTVSQLADVHGVDVWEVRALANRHPRVHLAVPGIGAGGHCLPVDPWFAVQGAPQAAELFAVCRQINDAQWLRALARVQGAIAAHVPIAVLGLAYKPQSDDLRNAPALALARALHAERDLVVHDPWAAVPADLHGVSLREAVARPAIVVAVAHDAYRGLRTSSEQVLIDLCGLWQSGSG